MWIISIPFAAFLIYGLCTGRMPIGAGVAWRVYSRVTQPGWYWGAGATHVVLIGLGIAGTFRPDIADSIVDAAAPIFWVIGLLLILAVMASAVRRKPRDGYLGDGQ